MRTCSSDACNSGERIVCQMIVNRSVRNTCQPTGEVMKARNSAMIKHIPLLSRTPRGKSVNSLVGLTLFPQMDSLEASHWGCSGAFHFVHLFRTNYRPGIYTMQKLRLTLMTLRL